MNIFLRAELKAMVEQKVRSGLYHTASEVVHDALLLLRERDRRRERQLTALRQEIAIGIEQAKRGELAILDMDKILVESRRRPAKRRKAR